MPKSNFNQFLDECEEFRTAETVSMSKISFETNPPCNDECENQTHQTHPNNENSHNHSHNHVNNLNTFSSNSNTRCGSSSSSSNIFLSKSANNSQGDRFDRFSTNRMNNYTNVTATTNATNAQSNVFRKMDNNNQCFNPIPTVKSTSTSVIEINNETFPSLTPAVTATVATTASSVPKKFKNFKDAICAAAPAPAAHVPTPSPTKQKQNRVLPNSAFPPPLVVKRDSEVYAKKMLAKTKNLAAFYDNNDDDDEDDDYDIHDFNCSRNSNPTFYNNHGNESD